MTNVLVIDSQITVKEAFEAMQIGGRKSLVVVDKEARFRGVLSDGDLRRAILAGLSLDDSINGVYNEEPTHFVTGQYSTSDAKEIFSSEGFSIIPVIDNRNRLEKILLLEEMFDESPVFVGGIIDVPVVIMAGGKGTRLEPFTKVLPKPLIPINDKPVIEHIIEKFILAGATELYVTVNYKSRILKAYFEEQELTYTLEVVEEDKPLGTAGSLGLIGKKLSRSFIVTNCDVIIDTDYGDLYKFHEEGDYVITLVATLKNYTIPYGTCELHDDGSLDYIKEKPEFNFFVNTGLYVVRPDCLELIPKDSIFDMTDFISLVNSHKGKIGVYPISEKLWVDVGQWAEYKRVVERV